MVSRGLVPGLREARELIGTRTVRVDGAPGLRPGTLVSGSSVISIERGRPYASRGGGKLAGALDDLELEVEGFRCLDAGAGSGGFTDVLLRRGARSVVAVDVGYGQFDWRLRNDPRVTLLERTNLRSLDPEPGRFDLVVADLSFVSLTSMAPQIAALAAPSAACLLLVKPQFEAAPEEVGPGGVVVEPAVWERAIGGVVAALERAGLGTQHVVPSRVRGATGNQEFFLLARPGAPGNPEAAAQARAALS